MNGSLGRVTVRRVRMSAVLKVTLVSNREDRPRYVTLIKYVERWVPVGDGLELRTLQPIRKTYEWVRGEDGEGQFEAFMCTRITELPWRAVKPQQAHRDLIAQWKEHMSTLTKGARKVTVEVVP